MSHLDNRFTGNDGDNILNGLAGRDEMSGGEDDDAYYVDNTGDRAFESANEGRYRVRSTVTFTLGSNVEVLELLGIGDIGGYGNALDNALTGNAGDNVLDGGAGADTMTGGRGNDVYYVVSVRDSVIEIANGGVDAVRSTLPVT